MATTVPVLRVVCYGGSLVAMLFLLAMYSAYSLDFPYADQWEFVPFLQDALEGRLGFADFWAQHNEHRLIFPRLLMLGLATASGWDIRWELAANFVLALLTWAAITLQIRRSGTMIHRGENTPVYLLCTLLLFSLSQWGNWFLGWQLQVFMNVLATVLAMMALTWSSAAGWGLATAVVLGTVATYSFANGLLIWPIGLLLLLLQRRERGGAFARHTGIWCIAGVLVIASYLYGYETPTYHAPLTEAMKHPLLCLLYVLAYLGQPVGRAEELVSLLFSILGQGNGTGDYMFSLLMGALGLLLWAVSLLQLLLFGVPKRALLPWLGLVLYAVGTAGLTALGRVDEGLVQAVSSRYVTIANLLWLPVVAQTYWVARVAEGRLIRRMLPWKIGVLCTLVLCASLAGAYRWTERFHAYGALREDVLHGNNPEVLRPVYPPDPAIVLERRRVLEQYGLGVFGEQNARGVDREVNIKDSGP